MLILAAGITDPVTLGLGVIAVALFFGEFAFFKWIYGPALERADKALASAEERHKAAMLAAEERHKLEVEVLNARIERLESKIDRQNEVLEDKALPALYAATNSVVQFQTLMEELRSEQEKLSRQREIQEAIERGGGYGSTKQS